MSRKNARLAALRARIREVDSAGAADAAAAGAVVVDVRSADEVAGGRVPGAHHVDRGWLELRIEQVAPDLDAPIILYCGFGQRSLFAAADLLDLGYTNVTSLAGGFDAWKAEGRPVEVPRALDAEARARYARHLNLPEVGEAGQLKLLDARVLIVGAGGLGSPAALYLAAAGVGTLGIVDHDVVDRGNLQRQVLHGDDRVGQPKVDSARQTLAALNPGVRLETHAERVGPDNVEALVGAYDVVVDGTDNFAARYAINDACVRAGVPNVHGAVHRFEGQAGVFWPAGPQGGPCYRCAFPAPPPPELAPSCAEAGVLGSMCGFIGTLQAVETTKLIVGAGDTLHGRLLSVDAMRMQVRELR
ncbi:MAG: molybdopterin-synthase adenylyltransferase MoeB, partial [Myxococcales bacterium]|nr:molybdopterin-synthase adenylyltransferase MoeB [Myxococcales bacterium]